jgi:SAM-dependent methyltransferase
LRPDIDRDSWERTWEPQLGAAAADRARPPLESYIDALKLEFLGKDLPRSGHAVEIGCGSARLLACVGRAAPLELVAVDRVPSALRLAAETARATGTRIRGMLADARALPLRERSVDLVLSGGLLEHFEDPQPVLAEMVRVLRPGGLLYADVVPRKLSLYRIREAPRMACSPRLMPGVFESARGPDEYRRALAALGCEPIRVRGAGVYPPWGARAWARLTRRLDGTPIADLLGWYFMIAARRAG